MITGDSNGSGAGMQIMGATDDVQIMGFGADAAPPAAGAMSPAMIMTPMHKKLSGLEKFGAVGAVLLVMGAVAYSMHKKG